MALDPLNRQGDTPSSIPKWAPVRPIRGPFGAQLCPTGAQPGPTWNAAWDSLFLDSTCDIELSDMRQGGKNYSDMGHGLFLNLTCDIVENKRQRHATLPFLKFDMRHWGPPIKGPSVSWYYSVIYKGYQKVPITESENRIIYLSDWSIWTYLYIDQSHMLELYVGTP